MVVLFPPTHEMFLVRFGFVVVLTLALIHELRKVHLCIAHDA